MASPRRVAGLCVLLGCIASCDRSESPVAPAPVHAVAADSAGGRIAFVSYRDGNNEIYVMNADGSGVTRLTDNPAIDQDPAWSPDGSRIAFTSTRDGNYEIYVMNADGSGVTRLTNDSNRDLAPAWCGTRIAFQSDRYLPPFYDVYVMNDDGTGATRLTISNASSDEAPSWSPSCDRIAYSYDPWGLAADLYVINADGSGNGMLGSGLGKNRFPAWSPDGTRIAFSSDRDNPGNTEEIYVMNANGTQETRLTVRADYHAFTYPAWSSDGARIAFQANAIASPGTYAMNADGSGLSQVADGVSGSRPAWFGTAGSPPPPNELPVPSFTASCSGLTCTFTSTSSDPDGTVVGYAWSFGDFTQSSAAQDPSHTYARGGTYNVKLVVTDNQGATNTAWQTVTVTTDPNQPPVASFHITCIDLGCSFTSTSSDADGSITAYSWTFGDGGTSTATNAWHDYAAVGTYTVTLRVTDNQGATDSTAQSLTLPQPNEPPVASFTTSCDGLTCHFNDTSHDANGSVTDLRWTFGDGGTSTIRFPSHTYAAGGSYTVTLTAYDNQGATNTASQTVTVTPPNQPPVASFTSDCAELTCSFTTTSSDTDGSIVSYSWTFGDGGTSTITNPSHSYAAAGTYTVTLSVMDDQGATNATSQTVSVTAPPPPPPSPAHVADLDGSTSSAGTSWSAAVVVSVVDAELSLVSGATVTGAWSRGGSSSCTTDATGTCTVVVADLRNRFHAVTFTVTGVTMADRAYDGAANGDPDGDSDGTSITVSRQ